jgi:hypothetical protein
MSTADPVVLRSRPIAAQTFNRWFIPVAALLIHVCIGSVYAWSTFNKLISSILHAGTDDWFKAGASKAAIYDQPLQILAGFLVVGFVLTVCVRLLKNAK